MNIYQDAPRMKLTISHARGNLKSVHTLVVMITPSRYYLFDSKSFVMIVILLLPFVAYVDAMVIRINLSRDYFVTHIYSSDEKRLAMFGMSTSNRSIRSLSTGHGNPRKLFRFATYEDFTRMEHMFLATVRDFGDFAARVEFSYAQFSLNGCATDVNWITVVALSAFNHVVWYMMTAMIRNPKDLNHCKRVAVRERSDSKELL